MLGLGFELMDPLKFIKENTYGIEKLNIPDDKKIDKLLLSLSTVRVVTAVQPIPFAANIDSLVYSLQYFL